ncbi:MAG: hypothetical protein D3912_06615 [Candidatus Electrothrix sp. AX1]|nr:hypothetical protein [Candidatus Electrothrix sp. AX1]
MSKLSCEYSNSNQEILKKMKLVLRIILGLVAVCVAGGAFLTWAMFGDHSSYGERLTEHELLPEAASDISLYRNQNFSGIFVADFTISEADFMSWAQSLDLQPELISEPQEIRDAQAFVHGEMNTFHIIKHGLYVSRRRPNGGGVDLAYNRDNGRGYIDRSSR